MVKNALDALELPVLDPRQWTPRAVLGRLAPGLAGGAHKAVRR